MRTCRAHILSSTVGQQLRVTQDPLLLLLLRWGEERGALQGPCRVQLPLRPLRDRRVQLRPREQVRLLLLLLLRWWWCCFVVMRLLLFGPVSATVVAGWHDFGPLSHPSFLVGFNPTSECWISPDSVARLGGWYECSVKLRCGPNKQTPVRLIELSAL